MQEVLFPETVPLAFKEDLEQRLFYLSEHIDDFRLIVGAAGVDGVSVRLGQQNAASATEVKEKILTAGASYKHRRRPVKAERIWANTSATNYQKDTFAQMCRRGLAFQTAPGLVAVSEPVMALTNYFDAELTTLVKRSFAAVEYLYPTLISSEVMRRSGYLRSFPQLMMFVTRLHRDAHAYHMVASTEQDAGYNRHYRDADLCLPPTMCYHVYQQHAAAAFPFQPGRVVTAKGKAFRFESKYEKNLERLWDFTIREIVFLGTASFVAEQRRRLMQEVFALFEEWRLTGYCETANDPFFVQDGQTNNGFMQRLMALKYELRLNRDDCATMAVASFNLHNDFFGRAFNILQPDGQHIRSACAGFGLERLVFAFLCQHGFEPAGWPEAVRARITMKEDKRC